MDENLLAVPSSTFVTAVPGFWLIALRNHVGVDAGIDPTVGVGTGVDAVGKVSPSGFAHGATIFRGVVPSRG